MGDSISEGTVQEYVKKVGEFVQADEIIAVVETDKVMVDIRSPKAGVITKFFANQGDTVTVNGDFFEIDTDATSGNSPSTPAAPVNPAQSQSPPKP